MDADEACGTELHRQDGTVQGMRSRQDAEVLRGRLRQNPSIQSHIYEDHPSGRRFLQSQGIGGE